MSLTDKLSQLAEAISLQVKVLPAQLWWRLGLSDPGALIDITAIPIPDTPIARQAEEHCRDVSPDFLVNHCLRTYLWAQCLAVPCRLRTDHEALWVASLLHDLGLTETYEDAGPDVHCFAVRSGLATRALLDSAAYSPSRCDHIVEAILLHLNVAVDIKYGAEALLLNAATALDVTGLRIWELHKDTVRAVVDRHPRIAMKKEITRVWREEAESHRRSRAHFLSHWLQFEERIRTAPFLE